MTAFIKRLLVLLLVSAAACLAAGPVYANCTNPAGVERDSFYNGDYHTYQFCNGTNWMAYGAIGSTGGLFLISTQTASNSASLSWTGLTGSNYMLTCQNIILATASKSLYLQFGEGAGPTWKTANYTDENVRGFGAASYNGGGSTTDSGIGLGWDSSAAPGTSLQLFLFSLSSSSAEKMVTGTVAQWQGVGAVQYSQANSGWYTGDTNPITAIRLIAETGNLTSGSCSLYSVAN